MLDDAHRAAWEARGALLAIDDMHLVRVGRVIPDKQLAEPPRCDVNAIRPVGSDAPRKNRALSPLNSIQQWDRWTERDEWSSAILIDRTAKWDAHHVPHCVTRSSRLLE
jgi:hypothetical protein